MGNILFGNKKSLRVCFAFSEVLRTPCFKFGAAEQSTQRRWWMEQVTPVVAEEAGNERLKVTERRRDEEMKEMDEMKGKGERCGGRPGGDQWGGCDAIWQVQLGDCPPPSAANWSIWRPITAAHVTRASSNPIITHAHAHTRAHTPSVQTSNDPPTPPLWSSCVPVHAPT